MRARGLDHAAADFERRGIGAISFCTRPRGSRSYIAYEDLAGTVFSVDKSYV